MWSWSHLSLLWQIPLGAIFPSEGTAKLGIVSREYCFRYVTWRWVIHDDVQKREIWSSFLSTQHLVAVQSILVSFPAAVLKHPERSNLREKSWPPFQPFRVVSAAVPEVSTQGVHGQEAGSSLCMQVFSPVSSFYAVPGPLLENGPAHNPDIFRCRLLRSRYATDSHKANLP